MRRSSPHSAAACAFTASRVLPPGGADAAALWEAAVGEKLDRPDAFLRLLYGQDEGRLAYLYDTIAEMDATAGGVRARPVDQGSRRAHEAVQGAGGGESNVVPPMATREAAVHPAALRRRLDAGARPGRPGRIAGVPRGAIVVDLGVRERRIAAGRGARPRRWRTMVPSMPPGSPKRLRRGTHEAEASGSISSHSASGRSAPPIEAPSPTS